MFKKRLLSVLLILLLLLTLLPAGGALAYADEGEDEEGTETVTHSVRLDRGDGGEPALLTVEDGGSVQEPAQPTMEGRVFAGWYSDAALTVPYSFGTPVTEDLTIYAAWTLQEEPGETPGDDTDVILTEAGSGEERTDEELTDEESTESSVPAAVSVVSAAEGEQLLSADAVTGTAYPLWLGNVQVTDANKDDILDDDTASFDPDSYTLTLKGAALTALYSEGETPALIYWGAIPRLTVTGTGSLNTAAAGSAGIYTQGALLISSAELIVRGGSYGVRSGGFCRVADSTLTAAGAVAAVYAGGGIELEGASLTEPAGGKIEGSTILDEDDVTATSVKLEKSAALRAPTTYQVRFETNGGSPKPAAQTVTSGQKASKPDDPARTGYRFDGWCSDSTLKTKYDFSKAVTGNLTLYAKWIETVTVRFDYNDGSGDVGTQTVDKGDTVGKLDRSRYNYLLQGWYTDTKLTKAYDFKSAVTANLTLYAKWIPLYTITAGKDGKWYKGGTSDYSITVKRSADDENCILYFTGVSIDDSSQLLDLKHYTVSSGSTVVRLKNAYLQTLSPGKHKATIYFSDGYVETSFTVHKGVATGDAQEPAFWLGMMLISAACCSLGLFTLSLDRRRR